VYSTEGNRIADRGDILVSVRAPVGRINLADRRLILGRGLSGIRPGRAPRNFLLHTLLYFFREEDNIGNGAIFNSVTRSDMESLPVLWPDGDLVERFEAIAVPLYELIHLLTRANAVLSCTRNLILPRLISGQVNVEKLHIQLAEEAT
jgi:type I restriction enzyme S subunit